MLVSLCGPQNDPVVNPYSVIELRNSSVEDQGKTSSLAILNELDLGKMKKIVLTAMATALILAAIAPAYAYDHHHHPVCHKVRVHHHWEKRCH